MLKRIISLIRSYAVNESLLIKRSYAVNESLLIKRS